jgi:hypothetical protein
MDIPSCSPDCAPLLLTTATKYILDVMKSNWILANSIITNAATKSDWAFINFISLSACTLYTAVRDDGVKIIADLKHEMNPLAILDTLQEFNSILSSRMRTYYNPDFHQNNLICLLEKDSLDDKRIVAERILSSVYQAITDSVSMFFIMISHQDKTRAASWKEGVQKILDPIQTKSKTSWDFLKAADIDHLDAFHDAMFSPDMSMMTPQSMKSKFNEVCEYLVSGPHEIESTDFEPSVSEYIIAQITKNK